MGRKSKYNNVTTPTKDKWKVGLYARLSREDEDRKDESNSITNQKLLLKNYIEDKDEFELFKIYEDDGKTGTNFDREGFQEMMADIRTGKINCVIVKDSSRLARDYAGAGDLVEKQLKQLGVRFIAINDGIDTFGHNNHGNDIMAFKFVFNEMYASDISKKVRSSLDIKRKKGEFIGAFATYGYMKDPVDKNKLIIDEVAAKVIKKIFNYYLQGYQQLTIARMLNDEGIPCPSEYKKRKGLKYKNANRLETTAYWTYSTIHRILNNQVYIGHMVQKKSEKISFKVNKKVSKPEEEQIVVYNTHEPIIDLNTWEKIRRKSSRDTRTSNNNQKISLFAGFLKCNDCGRAMHRKKGKQGKYYYVCGTYKIYGKNQCSSHSISEDELVEILLKDIQREAKLALMVEEVMELINKHLNNDKKKERWEINLRKLQKEKQKHSSRILESYEDFKGGLLTKDQYLSVKDKYEKQENEIDLQIIKIQEKISSSRQDDVINNTWLEQFKKRGEISELDREVIEELLDKIIVYEDGTIEIHYHFRSALLDIIKEIPDIDHTKFESLNTGTVGGR